MPKFDLDADELGAVLSVVREEIGNTKQFIEDTEPTRADHWRALREIEVLEAAKQKMEHWSFNAND